MDINTIQYNSLEWFAEARVSRNDKVSELATLFNIHKNLIPPIGIGYTSAVSVPPPTEAVKEITARVE